MKKLLMLLVLISIASSQLMSKDLCKTEYDKYTQCKKTECKKGTKVKKHECAVENPGKCKDDFKQWESCAKKEYNNPEMSAYDTITGLSDELDIAYKTHKSLDIYEDRGYGSEHMAYGSETMAYGSENR